MDRIQEVRQARVEVAKKAGARWKERAKERRETQRQLRRGGPRAANSADELARFEARRPVRTARAHILANVRTSFIERVIGTPDFADEPVSPAERAAGLPVACIAEIVGDRAAKTGFGTGFMIAPHLLMTNHHVFENAGQTIGCGAQFGHEITDAGLSEGETFEIDADTFFIADEKLDYAIVAIKPRSIAGGSISRWGHHKLMSDAGTVLKGHPVSIIQHPDGGPKKYASVNNEIVDLLDDHMHYRTDTRPGSSGSPAFNLLWEIVALHHSGVPNMDGDIVLNDDQQPWHPDQGDDAIDWIANEGVLISRILAHLGSQNIVDPQMRALRDSILAGAELLPLGETAELSDAPSVSPPGPTIVPAVGSNIVPPAHGAPVINVMGNATINFAAPESARTDASRVLTGEESVAVLEKKLKRDPDYGRRRGYDADFLTGFRIELPSVVDRRVPELWLDRFRNPKILDYHHFSLVMNKDWMLQMWSAVNVDYSPEVRYGLSRKDLGEDAWIEDPRIPGSLQIDDPELYEPAEKFDRGHIVGREDNAWGVTQEEMEFANSDTFHWTNCTPQHEDFNRAIFGHKGIWGKLERHITKQADAIGNRLTVFAGPVLDDGRSIPHDFGGGLFRVPYDFWKVLVVAEKRGRRRPRLRAYGFLMEQKKVIDRFGLERLRPEERFDVGPFEPQQRSLAELTRRTGVVFPDDILEADVMKGRDGDGREMRVIESLEDVEL